MSRRMADDLKRIIGIDNKSRPLEKRDPLPRVMGGYGVSIIEGETQPVENLIYEPNMYVIYNTVGNFNNLASNVGRVFSADNNYTAHQDTFSAAGISPNQNNFAICRNTRIAVFYLNSQNIYRFQIDSDAIWDADGSQLSTSASVCASKTHAFFAFSSDFSVEIRGYNLSNQDLDYQIVLTKSGNNEINFIQGMAISGDELLINYTQNGDAWGDYCSIYNLVNSSWRHYPYGFNFALNARPEMCSSYNGKFCMTVARFNPFRHELWVFDSDSAPTSGMMIESPAHTTQRLQGAIYTGYRVISTHREASSSVSNGGVISIYDIETSTWSLVHTMPDFYWAGSAVANADQEWEVQQ